MDASSNKKVFPTGGNIGLGSVQPSCLDGLDSVDLHTFEL